VWRGRPRPRNLTTESADLNLLSLPQEVAQAAVDSLRRPIRPHLRKKRRPRTTRPDSKISAKPAARKSRPPRWEASLCKTPHPACTPVQRNRRHPPLPGKQHRRHRPHPAGRLAVNSVLFCLSGFNSRAKRGRWVGSRRDHKNSPPAVRLAEEIEPCTFSSRCTPLRRRVCRMPTTTAAAAHILSSIKTITDINDGQTDPACHRQCCWPSR